MATQGKKISIEAHEDLLDELIEKRDRMANDILEKWGHAGGTLESDVKVDDDSVSGTQSSRDR